MDIKSGTQTWVKSSQEPINRDNTQTTSAIDQQKYFADKDVGDILNKVADPNWVENSKAQRKVGNSELGKDAFMSLLLTQMKNQDPTTPLKSHEMAAQLAQFTSLEKLTNIDKGIDGLTKSQQPSHNFEALTLIGKMVTTDSSKVIHAKDQSHDIKFQLPKDAQEVQLAIKDAEGNVVRTLTVNNLKAGKNEVAWNGQMEDGTPARAGNYTVGFQAKGSNGNKIAVASKIEGKITGVNFTASGPQMLVGKQTVDMSDIQTISEAQQEMEQQLSAAAATMVQPPQAAPNNQKNNKTVEVKPENKDNGKSDLAKAKMSGSLETANLSRELTQELTKQGIMSGM